MPTHIHASPGDVAPVVLLPGDPARATRTAELLAGSRQYTAFRGLLGYTGTWGGVPVSVQATGMGAPSAAIVAEELVMLGARTLVRIGTCGAIGGGVRCGDLVVADRAFSLDGTTRQYLGDADVPLPSARVTAALRTAAAATGRPTHTGPTLSEDGFYAPTDWDAWRARGAICVEMEASAIFTVAALRGIEAGCICLAVNDIATGEELAPTARPAAIDAMLRAALAAAAALSRA
ncbi:MAG: purine-nucleoside phosphorylase [Dehalococcoidia bacterium]|nr:purine-nucleoside phosphorylase [Dehalococcoidia bacterium]